MRQVSARDLVNICPWDEDVTETGGPQAEGLRRHGSCLLISGFCRLISWAVFLVPPAPGLGLRGCSPMSTIFQAISLMSPCLPSLAAPAGERCHDLQLPQSHGASWEEGEKWAPSTRQGWGPSRPDGCTPMVRGHSYGSGSPGAGRCQTRAAHSQGCSFQRHCSCQGESHHGRASLGQFAKDPSPSPSLRAEPRPAPPWEPTAPQAEVVCSLTGLRSQVGSWVAPGPCLPTGAGSQHPGQRPHSGPQEALGRPISQMGLAVPLRVPGETQAPHHHGAASIGRAGLLGHSGCTGREPICRPGGQGRLGRGLTRSPQPPSKYLTQEGLIL